MDDCPPDISFEECLKRMSKHQKITQVKVPNISSKSSSSSCIPVIKNMNSTVSAPMSSSGMSYSGSTSHGGGGSGGGSGMGLLLSFGNSRSNHHNNSQSGSWRNQTSNTSKGGMVVKNQTVVLKTNFEMAGRLNKQGKRPNAKAVGSHASASLSYMDNHGAKDLEKDENLSNTYDDNGNRISKEDLDALKKELNDGIGAFRRTIIDVGQSELDRDDLNRLVRESMQELKEQTGKSIDYVYAVHTDTDHIHAHVINYGSTSDVNLTKDHLVLFKEIVADKTEELLNEKTLEKDRDLTLHQQIDKEIDGVLDDNDNSKNIKLTLSL